MITVTFNDGESRIINPTRDFFAKDKDNFSLTEKIQSLIASMRGGAYKINCYDVNGDVIFTKTNNVNEPHAPALVLVESKEFRRERKALRNSFKNAKFAQKWNFTSGKFTNLVTGEYSFLQKIAA